MCGAGVPVAQRHGAALQHIACRKPGLHGAKAIACKRLQHGHQRRHDAQQGGGGIQPGFHVLQTAGRHGHALGAARQHVDADAHHHVARGAGGAGCGHAHHICCRARLGPHKTRGFHQDATQLAVARGAATGAQPQVVGPLQAHPRWLACAQRWQHRLQAFGHAHPHGQRQAGPVLGRQGQSQRHHQRRPYVALPYAPHPSAPCGLLLGHHQRGIALAGARAAHEFGVGRINGGQHLHRKTR